MVIVRTDSGIQNLRDLSGKQMLFGDKHSFAKYITMELLFSANGMDINRDLSSYSFGQDCEDIALKVYLEMFDAGAVDSWSWDEIKRGRTGVPPGKLKAIAWSREVPFWILAPHKNLDKNIMVKVCNALLALRTSNPDHVKFLNGSEISGFMHVDTKTLQEIMQSLQYPKPDP